MAVPRSPLINVKTCLMIAPKASFNYEMFVWEITAENRAKLLEVRPLSSLWRVLYDNNKQTLCFEFSLLSFCSS